MRFAYAYTWYWQLWQKSITNCFFFSFSYICYILICIYTCIYMQNHNDTTIKDERRFLEKNMYLSLHCKGSKRVTQGFTVRGSWRPNITATFWPPLLWPSALCLSRSPDAQPEATGVQLSAESWLSLLYLISNFSRPPTHQGPKGPLRRTFSTPYLLTRLYSNWL